MQLGCWRQRSALWHLSHFLNGLLIYAVLATAAGAVTNTFTINLTAVQTPGPSQHLFNNPYYSCSTNRYIATAGNGGSDAADGTTATVGGGHGPWLTLAHANAATPAAGWCINVQPGSYATGVSITNGGSTASSSGYVVYRCTTLDGCTITDSGTQTFSAAFGVGANYIIIDGFTMAAATPNGVFQSGVSTCNNSGCNGTNAFGFHHIWVLNSIISGYGQSGIQLNNGEYFYSIHNTTFQTGHSCSSAQGSGISYYLPIAIASYTPTADDQNNVVTGNTGTLFRQFVMWNATYNNYINNCGVGSDTDGNGIIMDDWRGDQFVTPTGAVTYVNGGLVAFNVGYNNGGSAVHIFTSAYVTVANNSAYNNVLDLDNSGTFRPGIGDNGSYGNNFINNISVPICGAGVLIGNSAIGVYGSNDGGTFSTTLAAAVTTTGQTSITLTSATNFPGGTAWTANFRVSNGSFALPGGNMIQIGSEIMRVTAGWGTTTLTVQRGFLGTTASTYTNGTTVLWQQEYLTNNITNVTTCGGEIDIGAGSTGAYVFYSTTLNKLGTVPSWVNVANTSVGSESVPPVGSNFALQGTSAAVGYGTTASPFNFLPPSAVDAGACHSVLTTCP